MSQISMAPSPSAAAPRYAGGTEIRASSAARAEGAPGGSELRGSGVHDFRRERAPRHPRNLEDEA